MLQKILKKLDEFERIKKGRPIPQPNQFVALIPMVIL